MDFKALNLLYMFSKNFSHKKIRSHDLTDTECMICSYVYEHADCSQDDVVRLLMYDKTTVGKALQKLEARGYVTRRRSSSDKRRMALRITEYGLSRISDVVGLHNEWLNEVLACLSEDEQAQFEDYCRRLIAAAEALSEKQRNEDIDNA